MKFKKTGLFVLATFFLGLAIYYFEFVQKEQKKTAEITASVVIQFKKDEINFFQIQTKNQLITLQKNEKNWQITEPIQDLADQGVISEILQSMTEQTLQNIESAAVANPADFGLDQPLATYLVKSRLGQSVQIKIGTQKNFEGQPFALINDDYKVKIVQSFWQTNAEKNVTFFREKKLYRGDLGDLTRVRIQALNDDFELEKKDQKWFSTLHLDFDLDQNQVRKMIKEFSEATIQDYISDGDPSEKEKTLKGLIEAPVNIQFETENSKWTSSLNLNENDKALYALTTQPTYFVKLDISKWQNFANATLDSLRDRKTWMTFSVADVQRIYTKIQGSDYDFSNEKQTWLLKSKLKDQSEFLPTQVEKILNQIHDLSISEFIDLKTAQKFEGQNMIILKSSSDQLVFQLNWGPLLKMKFNGETKEVYLARTQVSKNIFAIDKNKLDELNFDRVFKKTEPLTSEPQK